MIAIIETNLGDIEILFKQIPIIFFQYTNLTFVFSKKAANTSLKDSNDNLCLKKIRKSLFGYLFNLFHNKLEAF